MSALDEQMSGMQDIMLVGHSKGGNLLLNYLQQGDNAYNPKLKSVVLIDAPSKNDNWLDNNIHLYANTKPTDPSLPASVDSQGRNRVPVWNLYNPIDAFNHGWNGAIDGAFNVSSLDIWGYHTHQDSWAGLLTYPRIGDHNARTE